MYVIKPRSFRRLNLAGYDPRTQRLIDLGVQIGDVGGGSQGFQGPHGTGFQGYRGFQGPHGTGFQGYRGFQGPRGAGNTGSTGATGPAGPSSEEVIYTLDGGGATISGTNKRYRTIAAAGTIVSYRVLADQSGSITVTLKKCTFSGFPSTSDITGGNNIVLSSAQKVEDTTLTGWTGTSVSAGDIWEFAVSGTPTSVQAVSVFVKIAR